MSLTEKQTEQLRAKLKHRHVKTRVSNGTTISYLEGWHVIAEANRIFGHDGWDRQTQDPTCLWTQSRGGETTCFYSTKVRITVRAGDTQAVREGIGTGFGRAATSEAAHEVALKAAETDATKRALATFGNPFGLALYEKGQPNVTKVRPKSPQAAPGFVLRLESNTEQVFFDWQSFCSAVVKAIEELATVDEVYSFWEINLSSFAALRDGNRDAAANIIEALKHRARNVSQAARARAQETGTAAHGSEEPTALTFGKERRRRDKDHLEYVASQPCLICGRRPAQAHHLKFAQARSMALKVSDEYTVPLCNVHHDALHRTGDERKYWARNGITDPLGIAARLWSESRGEHVHQPAGDDDRADRFGAPDQPTT